MSEQSHTTFAARRNAASRAAASKTSVPSPGIFATGGAAEAHGIATSGAASSQKPARGTAAVGVTPCLTGSELSRPLENSYTPSMSPRSSASIANQVMFWLGGIASDGMFALLSASMRRVCWEHQFSRLHLLLRSSEAPAAMKALAKLRCSRSRSRDSSSTRVGLKLRHF